MKKHPEKIFSIIFPNKIKCFHAAWILLGPEFAVADGEDLPQDDPIHKDHHHINMVCHMDPRPSPQLYKWDEEI